MSENKVYDALVEILESDNLADIKTIATIAHREAYLQMKLVSATRKFIDSIKEIADILETSDIENNGD